VTKSDNYYFILVAQMSKHHMFPVTLTNTSRVNIGYDGYSAQLIVAISAESHSKRLPNIQTVVMSPPEM